MFDKTLFITDNFCSPSELAELKSEYNRVLGMGLAGNSVLRRFTRFGHYDAFGFIPDLQFTPNDLRKRIYSPEYMSQMEAQFNLKLTPEAMYEWHYHLPKGESGYAHTDEQKVGVRTTPNKDGLYYFQGGHNYRIDAKMPLEAGGVLRRRIIGNILYVHDDWEPGTGGETAFFDRKFVDGKAVFDPTTLVTPLPNRVVTFMTDSNSWHASVLALNVRRTVVWWYHAD